MPSGERREDFGRPQPASGVASAGDADTGGFGGTGASRRGERRGPRAQTPFRQTILEAYGLLPGRPPHPGRQAECGLSFEAMFLGSRCK